MKSIMIVLIVLTVSLSGCIVVPAHLEPDHPIGYHHDRDEVHHFHFNK